MMLPCSRSFPLLLAPAAIADEFHLSNNRNSLCSSNSRRSIGFSKNLNIVSIYWRSLPLFRDWKRSLVVTDFLSTQILSVRTKSPTVSIIGMIQKLFFAKYIGVADKNSRVSTTIMSSFSRSRTRSATYFDILIGVAGSTFSTLVDSKSWIFFFSSDSL